MRAKILLRKIHYWLSIVVAAPLLLVIISGLLLQTKKQIPWIQPAEQRGASGEITVDFEQVLTLAQSAPKAGIHTWDDVHRVDYRPSKSLIKVSTRAGWEVQIDPVAGEVLQAAKRRSDIIESLHDGSWFGSLAKYAIFLPSGLVLLILWLTGIYLFILPLTRKRRRSPTA